MVLFYITISKNVCCRDLNFDGTFDAFFPDILANEITQMCYVEARGSSPIAPSTPFVSASIPSISCSTTKLLWLDDGTRDTIIINRSKINKWF
jgi:hypothetical protein